MTPAATLHHGDVLELCGERFTAREVAPLWWYEGPAGSVARAVLGMERADVYDVMQRMLREIPGGRGAWQAMKREILRLERPGDPRLHTDGDHTFGLVRIQACEPANPPSPGPPVILTLGDRRTFLAFDDVERARAWARRVQKVMTPAWQKFDAEYWPWNANRFRPRIAHTGGIHGFTEMEAALQQILARERALKRRGSRRRPR
jgi:hypothetical protein